MNVQVRISDNACIPLIPGLLLQDLSRFLDRLGGVRVVIDRLNHENIDANLSRQQEGQERFQESIARVLEEEPEMRLSVLQNLHASGAGTKLLPGVLETCLKDPDPRTRVQAAGALLEFGDPEGLVLLLTAVQDRRFFLGDPWGVRQAKRAASHLTAWSGADHDYVADFK